MVFEAWSLKWFAARAESIELRCYAHCDTRTKVLRHLLHRERLGEHVLFDSDKAREERAKTDILYELSNRFSDGLHPYVPSTRVEHCVALL